MQTLRRARAWSGPGQEGRRSAYCPVLSEGYGRRCGRRLQGQGHTGLDRHFFSPTRDGIQWQVRIANVAGL